MVDTTRRCHGGQPFDAARSIVHQCLEVRLLQPRYMADDKRCIEAADAKGIPVQCAQSRIAFMYKPEAAALLGTVLRVPHVSIQSELDCREWLTQHRLVVHYAHTAGLINDHQHATFQQLYARKLGALLL